jgi:hypothetical protein
LVSMMVKLHCSSLAERALIPAFVFFFFMLYPPDGSTIPDAGPPPLQAEISLFAPKRWQRSVASGPFATN